MAFSVTNIIDTARDLYNATGDTFFSDTLIYNWVTQGCNVLAREAKIIETTSTTPSVASTSDYAYPTGVIEIKRVLYDGKKLQKITQREYDALTVPGTGSSTTGTPVFYTDFASTISLYPVPDAVETITFYTYSLQTQVSSGSTTLLIPEIFEMDLVNYLLMHMYSKDKDFVSAAFYRDAWTKSVIQAIKYTKDKKRADTFATVQVEELVPSTIMGAV